MNENFQQKVIQLFKSYDILFNDSMIEKFDIYKNFLIEYNKKVNLTAITEPDEIAVKHFVDSLMLLKYCNIKENAKIIDIGTGAGFPGVPLKIVRDDLNLTLLDSLNKRIVFLNELCEKINVTANIIHARAEECRINNLSEKYDVVVSRAVAPLNILLELCIPYLKNGGFFIAMKGSDVKEEIKLSANALKVLNSEIENTEEFFIDSNIKRSVIKIRKKSTINEKYPRIYSKIKKSPL